MRKPLSLSVRVGTVLVICGVVPFANGCRSTRSSLSSLPGLAWVAPSDDDARFGGWSEDDGPTLPAPSSGATPQLASKSGVTSLESTNRRAVATSTESSDPNAYAQASYPDTGYDPPLESGSKSRSRTAAATSAVSRGSGYSTGNYDAGAGRMAAAAKNAAPKRGFYSDDYPAEDESPTSTADSRYGDEEPRSAAPSSRYASDASYGRYGETDNAGNGRYGDTTESVENAADAAEEQVADTMSRARASSNRWADDAADRYGDVTNETDSDVDEQVSSTQSMARNVAGDLQNTIDTASAGVRDRFSASAESLMEKGRNLGREADSLAQRAISRGGEAVEAEAAESESGASDAANRYGELSDAADRWQSNARDAGDRIRSAVAEGSAPAGTAADDYEGAAANESRSSDEWNSEAEVEQPASSKSAPTAPVRGTQPWRPGSTGRVSANGGTSVTPASYEASERSTSRFAPSYR